MKKIIMLVILTFALIGCDVPDKFKIAKAVAVAELNRRGVSEITVTSVDVINYYGSYGFGVIAFGYDVDGVIVDCAVTGRVSEDKITYYNVGIAKRSIKWKH